MPAQIGALKAKESPLWFHIIPNTGKGLVHSATEQLNIFQLNQEQFVPFSEVPSSFW